MKELKPLIFKNQQTQDLSKVEIVTDRLLLKPISFNYAEDIFENFTASVTKLMCPSPASNISETRDFIKSSIEKLELSNELVCVVLDKSSNKFLGCCGFHGGDNVNAPEFGVWIREAEHGKGFGFEAVSAMKNWADNNLIFDYLAYPVDRQNLSSRKIPEKLGGKVLEEKLHKVNCGKELDLLVYRINS